MSRGLREAYTTEVEEPARGIWWGRTVDVQLHVNIFCEDQAKGIFSVHLSARVDDELSDAPELDTLLHAVMRDLRTWGVEALEVHALNTA